MCKRCSRIKVLYTVPNFDTAGSGKVLLTIAKNLDRDIFEPHICCFHDRGVGFQEVLKSGIPFHLFDYVASMSNRTAGLLRVLRNAAFFRNTNMDMVHSFHYSDDYSEGMAVRLAGLKYVYTKKNMSWGGASKRSWALRTLLANGVVAVNTDMMNGFFKGNKRAYMIPPSVDTGTFSPRSKNHDLLSRYGIDSSSLVVMTVAQVLPVKGIDVLVKAFLNLPEHVNANLVIVGDDRGEYADGIKYDLQHSQRQAKIIFTGLQREIPALLSCADLFVLASSDIGRQEGSPIALLEAMSSEKIVLASDVPGIRDQLSPYTELMFVPRNVDMLSKKMEWALCMDPDERSRYGVQLRNHVKENYSIEKEAKRHEEMYFSVLAGH